MMKKLALVYFLSQVSMSAFGASVAVIPSTTTLTTGDVFDVYINGLGFPDITDGGGLSVIFDAATLQVQRVDVDTNVWEFYSSGGSIDNINGRVDDIVFNSFEGRTGNFSIAKISFQATHVGSSAIVLVESVLNPFASGGSRLDPPVELSSANVTVAPIPGTLSLLLSSMLPLGVRICWRRKIRSEIEPS